MLLKVGASLFTFVLVFNSIHCLDQTQQVQNVGTFLNQLLRDYVPKNARPYTIINGVPPNLNSPIGRAGVAQTRPQFGMPPYGQLIVAPPPQKPKLHASQDRWSPVFPLIQTGQRGRSEIQFVPVQPQYDSGESREIEDSQEIITADHGIKSFAGQDHETAEFQIQSQMAF